MNDEDILSKLAWIDQVTDLVEETLITHGLAYELALTFKTYHTTCPKGGLPEMVRNTEIEKIGIVEYVCSQCEHKIMLTYITKLPEDTDQI